MAKYDSALAKTLIYEGGYVNDPLDSGGETYKGVSRKNWSSWSGWQIIDLAKKNFPNEFKKKLDSNNDLQKAIADFYYINFWLKIGGDKLINDHIAAEIFDTAVNNGINTAIKLVQAALEIPQTGKLDNNILNKLNQLS